MFLSTKIGVLYLAVQVDADITLWKVDDVVGENRQSSWSKPMITGS